MYSQRHPLPPSLRTGANIKQEEEEEEEEEAPADGYTCRILQPKSAPLVSGSYKLDAITAPVVQSPVASAGPCVGP
ncbi:hypothetical protein CSUB01_11390 [Colletotrichum sublineola]|uniref:Uncharacterized protein n=1 Tax=Colletotrichum sublineola TaxID=1173701 RepID=A0A066XM80_COLSU|nr:hypothetical protein CSUB01_11390 [Colletotrichum sublineola]